MRIVPQRLFGLSSVSTLLSDGQSCVLSKLLIGPSLDNESYISTHVISVILSGTQRIKTYDGKVFEVKAGEFIFLPRGLYTVSDLLPNQANFSCLLFYISDELIQNFLQQSRYKPQNTNLFTTEFYKQQPFSIQIYLTAFQQLSTIFQKDDTQLLHIKINELLHLITLSYPAFKAHLFKASLPSKRNLEGFMTANFDKPLKVEDYAYLTGRSTSSFRRDFKNVFDNTPQQWLKERRLEKAKNLLEGLDKTVTEVAFDVGYESISYFIKAFKEKYNYSPKQFLLQKRTNQLVG